MEALEISRCLWRLREVRQAFHTASTAGDTINYTGTPPETTLVYSWDEFLILGEEVME
ncbi:MAG: hypothetical protein QM758_19070 [Armatimonas sp.]